MFFVIVGGGKLGFYLAKILVEERHDVVVVEKDDRKSMEISEKLDIVTIKGSATSMDTLKKASIDEADAAIITTENDETNMIVGLLCKKLGAKRVVVKISNPEYKEDLFKELGIDMIFHPEAAAANYLEEWLTKPELIDLAFLSKGNAEIIEFEIKKDYKIKGKMVKDVKLPENSGIIAIFRKNDFILPKGEEILEEGDKILVLTKRDYSRRIGKFIY